MSQKKFTQKQRELALNRYLAGVPPKNIAAQFKCSTRIVLQWLCLANVPVVHKHPKTFFCPHPAQRVLQKGLADGSYIYTELGLELRCTICGQYWPADTSFFHRDASSSKGLHGYCIACSAERRRRYKFDSRQFDSWLNRYMQENALC